MPSELLLRDVDGHDVDDKLELRLLSELLFQYGLLKVFLLRSFGDVSFCVGGTGHPQLKVGIWRWLVPYDTV